ncbi:tripartite tricarboxylate transporter substrate-binding protein [Agrobacterium burrii]|uniref:Tripartite tricarboxylate transporter substrate binding protein BugD n=1 Tax=Agrobacterium burrii TaxID=2815339 RepID=A0ABS3EJU8_9HYPH|nr:tripartite tricarboxylate transporter substrate-binding protein [Agrobacterium burrii]MBO0132248.1 tripartite tricarboxylate transporter substrate binding protein BugD [Agrobacterium burrii]
MKLFALAAAFAALASSVSAQESNFPDHPVYFIVPFAAGGPTDTIARLTAEAMSKKLGQQVIVENVTGAGGTIAARRVAESDPDGYTVLIHHIGISTAPALYRKLPYDTLKAFEPIGLVSDAPMTVIARNDLEPNTLKELIDYIKAKGTDLTFGNAGLGAASHLCGALFQSTIGAKVTTVPYKGNGPVMTDLIGKQIDLSCDQSTNTVGPIKQKQVKAYNVTSPKRIEQLPDLPTSAESGLPQFEFGVWHGLYVPAGTPPEVVKKLNEGLQAAIVDPVVTARFKDIATRPATAEEATPEALRKKLESEINRWGPIIKQAGEFAD